MQNSRSALLCIVIAMWFGMGAVSAHLNSPHSFVEGDAGPWPLVVVVHMPPAVPGEAEMQIRFKEFQQEEDLKVFVRQIPPMGEEHAPDWVEAKQDPKDLAYFTAPMPLMVFGTWTLEVKVEGASGTGVLPVQVVAARPAPKTMPIPLRIELVALTLILFVSGFQMTAGLRRDAQLKKGEEPRSKDRFMARLSGWLGIVIFAIWLGFIAYSWSLADGNYQRLGLPSRSLEISTLRGELAVGSPVEQSFTLKDRKGQSLDPTSIMQEADGPPWHWIAFNKSSMEHFIHAHPVPVEDVSLRMAWVPPSAGEWRGFFDLPRTDGSVETIVKDFEIAPEGRGIKPSLVLKQDLMASAAPKGTLPVGAGEASLGNGLRVVRTSDDGAAYKAGEFYLMEFEVQDSSGSRVPLDSFEEATGHAFIIRHDGEVYVRIPSSANNDEGVLRFPYGFPEAGIYRIWIEVRQGNSPLATAFDVLVH